MHAETFMLCKHLFTFLAIFQHQAGVMYQPAEIQHPRVKTTLVLSHSKTKARFFTLDPWAEKLAKIDTEAQCWQTVHAPTSTAVQKNNFVWCSRSTHSVGEVHKTETSTFMSLNFLLFDNNHRCLCWHNNHITWQSTTTTTTTTTTMVDPPPFFLTEQQFQNDDDIAAMFLVRMIMFQQVDKQQCPLMNWDEHAALKQAVDAFPWHCHMTVESFEKLATIASPLVKGDEHRQACNGEPIPPELIVVMLHTLKSNQSLKHSIICFQLTSLDPQKSQSAVLPNGTKNPEPLECSMGVLAQLMVGCVAFTNQRMWTTQHTASADTVSDAESMFKWWWMQCWHSFALVQSDQAGQMMPEHSIDALNWDSGLTIYLRSASLLETMLDHHPMKFSFHSAEQWNIFPPIKLTTSAWASWGQKLRWLLDCSQPSGKSSGDQLVCIWNI